MNNPFEEQSEFFKSEYTNWSKRSKLVGIVLIIALIILFCI